MCLRGLGEESDPEDENEEFAEDERLTLALQQNLSLECHPQYDMATIFPPTPSSYSANNHKYSPSLLAFYYYYFFNFLIVKRGLCMPTDGLEGDGK